MRRLVLPLLLSTMTVAFVAPAAQAHTAVRETSIAENAQLGEAPETFTVVFTAPTGFASVRLASAAGEPIPLNYDPPREHGTTFVIPLPRLAQGRYTLSWRTISHDGHIVPGSVRFTVAGG